MYEIFEQLLQKYGVTPYKVSKDTGISQSTLSTWKSKRNKLSPDKAQILADYFGVSFSYFMTGKEAENKKPAITPKDERDIAKSVEKIIHELNSGDNSPLFYGDAIDEIDKGLINNALQNVLEVVKIKNKDKYTPKKYK